ncbi:MAG TPA: NADH-quinone oxidoreductase subunit NuoK [bacterium]|nr:NADH-quinone oxidoreductase subunit NuoK [bacterium]
MAPIGTEHFLVVAGLMFAFGALGVLWRRNAIGVLLSVEVMLNAGNVALVAFARQHGQVDGQALALFVMAVAAAEAAVGLALIVSVYRTRHTINLDDLHELKG